MKEHADVSSMLAVLPEDHPARLAYDEGADTIKLTHMVPPELVVGLDEASWSGYHCHLKRAGRAFQTVGFMPWFR